MADSRSIWGVVGGMGPLASAAFVETIYEACAGRLEQEMPVVFLASDPTFPDRTSALLAGDVQPLVRQLSLRVDQLVAMGADRVIVCCMTAHAVLHLLPERSRRRVVSLVDALLGCVVESRGRWVLLCSDGARQARVFERSPLWPAAAGRVVTPRGGDQSRIHRLIYDLKIGPPHSAHLDAIDDLVTRYDADGVAAGCTEIHLLLRDFRGHAAVKRRAGIDPLSVIARWIAVADPRLQTVGASA